MNSNAWIVLGAVQSTAAILEVIVAVARVLVGLL